MKRKIFSTLVFFITILFAISCTEDDYLYEEATLKVSEQVLLFAQNSSEGQIVVQTNRDKWEASSPQEDQWISLLKEGNTLKVKVSENTMGGERIGIIMIHAGDISERVEVIQKPSEVNFDLSVKDINFLTNGGKYKVNILSNSGREVNIDTENAEWINVKYKKGNKYFKVVASENANLQKS